MQTVSQKCDNEELHAEISNNILMLQIHFLLRSMLYLPHAHTSYYSTDVKGIIFPEL